MIEVIYAILFFCMTLFVVIRSADWILLSIQRLGESFDASPLVMGTILLGFGTSLPELFSALFSIQKNLNTVPISITTGSNLIAIGFIFALFILVASYKKIPLLEKTQIKYRMHCMFFGLITLLFLLFVVDGTVGRVEGGILFLTMILYTGFILTQRKRKRKEVLADDGLTHTEKKRLVAPFLIFKHLVFFFISILVISFSSFFLVDSLTILAGSIGVPTGVVALVLLAFGTSVPEIFVAISAIKKRALDYAAGNILGTCIFNIGIVTGVSAILIPLGVDPLGVDFKTYHIALPFMFVLSSLFFYIVYFKKQYVFLGYICLALITLFLYILSLPFG